MNRQGSPHDPLSRKVVVRIENHQDLRRTHRRHGPPTPLQEQIEEADLSTLLLFAEGVDLSDRLAQAIERHSLASPHAQRLLRRWLEWRERFDEMTGNGAPAREITRHVEAVLSAA